MDMICKPLALVSGPTKRYYRSLSQRCGRWAAIRCMRNRGYTPEQVLRVFPQPEKMT